MASLFIGCCMNGKAYLGTFDWTLGYNHIMGVAFILVMIQIPLTLFLVYEPPLKERPSFRAHLRASWQLVQSKSFVAVIMFAFGTHLMVTIATTAAPMVRARWAGVKVLQQQLCGMISTFTMLVAVWFFKVYFLQTSWRIFGLFTPSLYDAANYVEDTPAFRRTVAWSYAVTYGTTLAGFILIRLIPSQKEEALKRKKEWGSRRSYGVLVLVIPSICFMYAITVLVMANIPEMACSKIIGGRGCN